MASAEGYLALREFGRVVQQRGGCVGRRWFSRSCSRWGVECSRGGEKKIFFDCGERSVSERAIEGTCRDAPDRDTNVGPSE